MYISNSAALAVLLVALSALQASKQQEFSNNQENFQHINQPGHYEFELAPNMEPPSIRKPPYPASNQHCPGTDILGGFSPKDTLCGDLNQGRVPVNPLGHNIGNQPYPFELIRNKTLQFLARALPILKLEYESIPKVARLVPFTATSSLQQQQQQQQHRYLLNPTHAESPLGHSQLHQLNQRLGSSNAGLPYGLLRRKRRAVSSSSPSSSPVRTSGQQIMITATELSPNTSLVVSSAHSSPYYTTSSGASAGRIWDLDTSGSSQSPSSSELALITKDGYRQLGHNARVVPQRAQQGAGNSKQRTGEQPGRNNGADRAQLTTGSGSQNGLAINSGGSSEVNSTSWSASSYGAVNNNQHASHSSQDEEESPSRSVESSASSEAAAGTSSSSLVAASRQQTSASEQQAATSGNRKRISCADASNGFTAAICQAAAALIEPPERAPTWLQLAKQLGSAYANQLEASPSLWSLVSALANPAHQLLTNEQPERSASAKSSPGSSLARQGFGALLGPLSKLIIGTPISGSSGKVAHKDRASADQGEKAQSKETAHLKDSSSTSSQFTSSLASIGSSAMTKLALAGWASNAIASLIDYFVPSVFQSLSGRSFARRKKPYDPQESFVDTPASLAANLRREQQQQLALGKQPAAPPTPCPSVEEYISPTFARNYQGAWKYVVQIPHEGYFTQTIQRTSCTRSRCEFTDGVCHESPRWVSLLVAEIYYPNTVFTQPPGSSMVNQQVSQQVSNQQQQQQQQLAEQQLAAQSSTSSIQRAPANSLLDPLALQMIPSADGSTSAYNSALMNAPNELAWDPTSLQQLAYNYQLMQRNGLPANTNFYQQQPSTSDTLMARNSVAGAQSSTDQLGVSNEYLAALAQATLQQNPNINIQDLINSLSIPQTRKKRDLSIQQQQQAKQQQQIMQQQQQQQLLRQRQFAAQQQQQQQQQQPQHRSAETVTSMNDINSQILALNQQQQQLANPTNFNNKQSEQLQATSQTPSLGSNPNLATNSLDGTSGSQQQQQQQQQQPQQQDQQQANSECDGHDKLGCYVVRVYYDWFLVNGSCKCWKSTGSSQTQTGNFASSSSGNSFLRRIFTG